MEKMFVIKRDGNVVDFDQNKITAAITKANNNMTEEFKIKDSVILFISDYVVEEIRETIKQSLKNSGKEAIEVESIQDIVESVLVRYGNYNLAKEYIIYRYKRGISRRQNTTDDDILKLLANRNKLMAEENANKDTTMASTQRDYIAGITSRDITRRILLPEYISKAHDEGVLHFHDADYFIQPTFNCCLVNISDMLGNGTMINGKLIESPKSFQVACTVTTQIIASVASNQYGGQSIDMSHLGKYLRRSKDKFARKIKEAFPKHPSMTDEEYEATVENLVKERVQTELSNGIQTIQYQINTLYTTNGQSPFVTLFMHLKDDDPYVEENAMIFEELLKQRYLGIKNEKGVYITPAFPRKLGA